MSDCLWNSATESVLACLGPVRGATRTYPPGKPEIVGFRANRFSEGRAIYRELVPSILTAEDVEQYCLSETVVVVGYVTWSTEGRMTAYSLQAFVAVGSTVLEEALLMDVPATAHVVYLRCDYHPRDTGKLGAEPPVHVHVRGKGAPRLSLAPSTHPVLAFLELLSTNFDHDAWLAWAKRTASKAGLVDDFEDVAAGFEQGQIYVGWTDYSVKTQAVFSALEGAKNAATTPWEFAAVPPHESGYRLG